MRLVNDNLKNFCVMSSAIAKSQIRKEATAGLNEFKTTLELYEKMVLKDDRRPRENFSLYMVRIQLHQLISEIQSDMRLPECT